MSEGPVDGIFDYYSLSSDNVKTPYIQVNKGENGVSYEKAFESFDGTTSHIKYRKSKIVEKFDYVIEDKKKNILAQKHVFAKKLNENAYEQIIDGRRYFVKFDDSSCCVLDLQQGKEKKLHFDSFLKDKKAEFVSVIKSLWADEIMQIADRVKSLVFVPELFDSHVTADLDLMKSAELACYPEKTVVLHELGHEKFRKLVKNNDFLAVFNDERRNFKDNMPPIIQDMLRYFIEKTENMKGYFSIPSDEAAAEINVILNSPFFLKQTGSRTHFLQQYFPKTIAFVMRHRL